MHKRLLNEALFKLTISVRGPVLVKSGVETWEPTRPDMEFIRARHARFGDTVFLPGSSLKGMLRSYSEKIARTLNVTCCDPFDTQQDKSPTRFCGKRCEDLKKREKRELASEEVYQRSCVACKLFGSTVLAGRAAFADAYPTEDVRDYVSRRTGVGIDRVLGSASPGALYDYEVLERGAFQTAIRLRNFELWQVGLLGLALRDLCLGRIKVGFGKSRGFGDVVAHLHEVELRSLADDGLLLNDGKLTVKGIGAFAAMQKDAPSYGILSETETVTIAITASAPPKATDTDDWDTVEWLGDKFVFPFQPTAGSQDWCAPEVKQLFGKCVKTALAKHGKGGGNG